MIDNFIDILRSVIGSPPAGLEYLEYLCAFALVMFSLVVIFKIFEALVSVFR